MAVEERVKIINEPKTFEALPSAAKAAQVCEKSDVAR